MGRLRSAVVWGQWRERLERFGAAGVTVAEFCEWEGVSPAAFYAWRRKLGTESAAGPSFVQVVPAQRESADDRGRVVMTLGDGTRVDFPGSHSDLIAHVVLAIVRGER